MLKDTMSGKVYLLKFTPTKVNYSDRIPSTHIAQAEHFAVSDDYGYLFYSVKGQLYEYDPGNKTEILMASYDSKTINLLKFEDPRASLGEDLPPGSRYDILSKQLIVCSYDSANMNNSGQMDLYTVPPVNGQITKAASFTNLGKIVSLTYRNR